MKSLFTRQSTSGSKKTKTIPSLYIVCENVCRSLNKDHQQSSTLEAQ